MRLFSRVSCQRWISRAWRLRMGLFLWAAFIATVAHAGPQREEPLIDSVRTALSAAVHPSGPPTLVHADAKAAQMFQQWLTEMEVRLDKQLQARKSSAVPSSLGIAESSARAMPDLLAHELASPHLRREFLQTIWYESQRAGLEPSLLLGLIQVESGFRKFAISTAGARGFTQVMPFWTQVLAEGDASVLFQTQTNLRFGCVILRHYLDLEAGDLVMALGRYNGSRGQMPYPNAVLAAKKRWQ
jgi:soluble lytic murein transglycosylase-like protein